MAVSQFLFYSCCFHPFIWNLECRKLIREAFFSLFFQIDYSSLVDVRLVKHGNSKRIAAIADGSNENCAQDQDVLTSRQPNGSMEAALVSAPPPAQGINNAQIVKYQVM